MRNDHIIRKDLGPNADKRFFRYESVYALGQHIGDGNCIPPSVAARTRQLMEDYRRTLVAKFRHSIGDALAMRPDVTGIMYDMGDAMAGNPDCWQHVTVSRSPIYRIGLNPSSAMGSHGNILAMRGAAVCAIIDLIELSGARMEIDWCYGESGAGTHGPNAFHARVTLKHADQPLDMLRIGEWIAGTEPTVQHGSYLNMGWGDNPTAFGVHITDKMAATRGLLVSQCYRFWQSPCLQGEFDIVLDRIESEAWDEAYTESWVKDQIKALSAGTHAALAP
jgi:hypothetical protein